MPDRYQTLFGASRPALDPALLGPEWVEEGIFLRNTKTGERRLKQIPAPKTERTIIAPGRGGRMETRIVEDRPADIIYEDEEGWDPNRMGNQVGGAPNWRKTADPVLLAKRRAELARIRASGDIGVVPTPDTSLPAIAKEYLGLAGATAATTNVGIARLSSFVGADAASRAVGRRLETLTPRGQQRQSKEADAYLKLFGSPAGRAAAETIEDQRRARMEQLDPLARTAEMTAEWERAARERLAEATQDLPTPLAVAAHQGATMAGFLADPTLGAGASRAPRALSEAAQEAAIAAGRKPGLGVRTEAVLQKGYGKLRDLDEADALTRDMLNRNPGFREAYYGDRLDEVEVGLQRLREAEDAAPIPPYLRHGDRAPQALPAAGIAPPGPETRGGIVASTSGIDPKAGASPPLGNQIASAVPDQSEILPGPGAGASPPLRSKIAGQAQDADGVVVAFPGSEASPPLGPRSGEAGFIKLLPDPLSPADAAAKEAGWQMRKEYAATNRLGRYRAGAQAEELQRLIPKETDEALTWMFHGLGDPRNYANRPPRVQARIAKKTAAQRRVIDQILADPNAETALQEVAAWRERSKEMWDDLSEMWDLGFVKNYLHMTYEPPPGIRPGDAFRRASATPGMARQRTFMNPAEALAAGYTPRTLRFSQLRAETEKVFAHAQAVKGLVDDLGSMPLLQDGRAPLLYATAGKQPAGYVHVPEWARPVFDAAARRSTTSGRALPGAVKHAEALQAESRRAAETAGGFFRYTDEGKAVPSVLEQPMIPHTETGRFRYGAADRGTMIPSHKEWEGLGPRTFRPPQTPTTPDDLWVHPEIWKELKPVLDTAEPIAIDRFLGTVKRVKFLGSIFHPFELGLAAMQSMGPVKGARAWASRGGGLPGLAQLAERRGWATPFTREVTEKWVRRGLGVEAPSADMMTDSFQRAMVGFEDAMQRAAGGPAGRLAQGAGAAGRGLRKVAGYYDEAIWEVLHSKIKIAAAEQWEAQIRAALAGDRGAMGVANRFLTGRTRGKLAAMSEEEIGEAVASAINNHFGGQVWELSRNALFSDPRALKWMRRIFLSPDWNVSAISSGLAPLSRDPVHRIIGRTYWTNITALAAGFAALNYSLTAGSEQGPHFPWQNEEGHKMDLETPFRTDKGRKIFYRVGKHAQELPHFAWGVPGAQQMKFILGKTAPIIHAAAGLAGESVTEYPSPYEELVRERERTGETPGPVENLASRLQPSVEMMLPFSLQDAEDPGDVLRKLLISIPESKGMSTFKAENLYADALVKQAKAQEAGDAEGVAEAEARMGQIVTWLRQNGYDDEQINFMVNGAIRSGGAMGKAKRRLRAGR